jgi:hypothetical protein
VPSHQPRRNTRLQKTFDECRLKKFDGNLLQIMPWPGLRDMSDQDLRAIYECLSTVPCVQGNYPGDAASRCR